MDSLPTELSGKTCSRSGPNWGGAVLVPTRRLTTLWLSTGAVLTRRPAPAPESPRPQVAPNLTRPLQTTLSARGKPSPARVQVIGHHCPKEGRPGSTLSTALGSPGGCLWPKLPPALLEPGHLGPFLHRRPRQRGSGRWGPRGEQGTLAGTTGHSAP